MQLARSTGIRIVAVWLAVAVFFSAENILVGAARHRPFDWQWDIFHELVYWLVWAAFTPIILRAGRRWPLGPGGLPRVVAPHLGVMALLAPTQIVIAYTAHYLLLAVIGLRPAVTLGAWLGGLGGGIVWGTLTAFLYYWLILGVHAAFVYQRMYQAQRIATAELEGRLAQAQLEALRLQLHPHFLFNTLNAIAAFVGPEPDRARRMIARLGELLRRTLDSGTAAEVPLARELDLLAPYLEIQRIRFGERLHVEVDIPAAARTALVPTLLLQPLVENAVEHGVRRQPGSATVRLHALPAGERLRLEITDDGPGPPAAGRDDGIGLANTRERLARLYGSAHRFELSPAGAAGTTVAIEIPLRTAEGA